MTIPQGPNRRWSTDFLHDVLTDGRRFRVWALVDDFSRECLALVVDTSISGRRVARELDRMVELRGTPCRIVRDNDRDGPWPLQGRASRRDEFTQNAMPT